MGGLRSALDEVAQLDFAELADARLEEEFAELQHANRVLEAVRLRCLAEIDRRASFQANGFISTASWLADRFRGGHGAARDEVRTARALQEMPETQAAFASGELSRESVRVLAGAQETAPEVFRSHEPILLEAARRHTVKELQIAVAYWKQVADAGDAERLFERRRLHVSPVLDGMVRIDGDLDPETGETVLTALRAVVDADVRGSDAGDSRTPAQRRADALGELCRHFLDQADRPYVAGERPHVTVTVDVTTLKGRSGGVSEFDHTGPLPACAARHWACDASISRVVMGPRSEPLDVGRRTPVVPAAMRRAVVARDLSCRFPGCDHPHTWCDAHHAVHRADGGPTALSNLVLLCRRHHHLIHRPNGFRLQLLEGRPVIRRPDGLLLEERAPP